MDGARYAEAADLNGLRATILSRFPDLEGASFSLLTAGWDHLAVDAEDRFIFRFPRNAGAAAGLAREARILEIVRPEVAMPVPDLSLHAGPPPFSRHAKLPGEHLLSEQYSRLSAKDRHSLAADLARFFHELHQVDFEPLRAAGVGAIADWLPADEIIRRVEPVLPPRIMRYADRVLTAWRELPEDPCGVTFGFFDGHGWNMAFDHRRNRLNGIYDFGDAGFGALHQEFIYSNFISADLTDLVVEAYEDLSGLDLDRARIALLTGVHRLSELAGSVHDPDWLPVLVGYVESWAASHPD